MSGKHQQTNDKFNRSYRKPAVIFVHLRPHVWTPSWEFCGLRNCHLKYHRSDFHGDPWHEHECKYWFKNIKLNDENQTRMLEE
jgi:hypothetical protein